MNGRVGLHEVCYGPALVMSPTHNKLHGGQISKKYLKIKYTPLYEICRNIPMPSPTWAPDRFFYFLDFSFQNVVNLMVENISNTPKIHQTFV
jgi:hypothetical protein